MTCTCTSKSEHAARATSRQAESHRYEMERIKKELATLKADISSYEVIDAEAVGNDNISYLALKLKYLHSKGVTPKGGCTFEGVKVLVFRNVGMMDALRWNEIDPHFRKEDEAPFDAHKAPAPIARFPGDAGGWGDALKFIEMKMGG